MQERVNAAEMSVGITRSFKQGTGVLPYQNDEFVLQIRIFWGEVMIGKKRAL